MTSTPAPSSIPRPIQGQASYLQGTDPDLRGPRVIHASESRKENAYA